MVAVKPIGRGRNSRVYHVTCDSGRRYAAKFYFRHPLDGRDRLAVEFSSLQFLHANGLRSVPQPIKADPEGGFAIYEYVDGDVVPSSTVTLVEIDGAVGFLAALRALRDQDGSRAFGSASEACFSVRAYVQSIERRLGRLPNGPGSTAAHTALRRFLDGAFVPSFQRIMRWVQASLERWAIAYDEELGQEEQTLSPSDFGFHNALRRGGQLVFLDFEYFGWDDPAKMGADVLLHPAMALDQDLKRRFVAGLRAHFGHRVAKRLEIVYPLCGLKWSLILLNEFVPQDSLRRDFAQTTPQDLRDVQMEQLAKARQMLSTVMQDYERFPYSRA